MDAPDIWPLWQWDSTAWIPCHSPPPPCFIAESWLLQNGHLWAWDAHKIRFTRSCNLYLPATLQHLPGLVFEQISAVLPLHGHYFPRLEMALTSALPQFYLRIRAAPAAKRTLSLLPWTTDPRTLAHLKGPDLLRIAECRSEVMAAGADEAVLVDAQEHVLEGLYSSLVWWQQDTLCYPPPHPQRLSSTTLPLLVQLAAQLGVTTCCCNIKLHTLTHHPVWAVNALHGLMEALSLPPGTPLPRHPDIAQWQQALNALRQPLPVPSSNAGCRLRRGPE